MIYLDNAATTLKKPPEVIRAVTDALSSFGNAGRGAHDASLGAARIIYETRELLASFFHAESPSRIAFTCNATESLNLAIRGCLQPGDHVITTVLEHNSVLRPLYELQSFGVSLTILPCDEKGYVSCEAFVRAIRPETKLIACTGASNVTGNLLPIAEIGAAAHARGILFLVDASQLAGVYPIDVQRMQIDLLCFTGHKALYGPQGTGGIYVREGVTLRPLKSGGSGIDSFNRAHPSVMPTALEAGTLNGHGIAGLRAALLYLADTGIDAIRETELRLTRRFYAQVSALPNVTVYGDASAKERCPIVSLNIRGMDSAFVSDALLTEFSVAVRAGAHCAPLMHEALKTVRQGAVRFSFSHFNTESEVDAAAAAVREIAGWE